jgi:hypothetical protein
MELSAAVALAITASFDGLLSMDRYHQELFHRQGMNSRATAVLRKMTFCKFWSHRYQTTKRLQFMAAHDRQLQTSAQERLLLTCIRTSTVET